MTGCPDKLDNIGDELENIRSVDGIKKIVNPVFALLKDFDEVNYASIKPDGDKVAIFVQSKSLAKETGGVLEDIKEALESIDTKTSRLTAHEPFDGTGDTDHTFTTPMQGFVIINDGSGLLTFTINEETFKVKASEKFPELFETFTEVNIVTTGAFRAYGLGV
jgi:hypothetical protein